MKRNTLKTRFVATLALGTFLAIPQVASAADYCSPWDILCLVGLTFPTPNSSTPIRAPQPVVNPTPVLTRAPQPVVNPIPVLTRAPQPVVNPTPTLTRAPQPVVNPTPTLTRAPQPVVNPIPTLTRARVPAGG